MRDWLRAHPLAVKTRLSRRDRDRALVRLGALAVSAQNVEKEDHLPGVLEQVKPLREELKVLEAALEASLQRDRDDYTSANEWVRWLIVARGLLDRVVLRDRRRRVHKALAPLSQIAGEAVLEGRWSRTTVQGSTELDAAELAVETDSRLRAELGGLLQPYEGRLYPPWVQKAAAEVWGLGTVVGKEVQSRTLPKLPALVGLVAGYWVTQNFTTSRWTGFMSTLGLHRGSERVISQDDYDLLKFWVPLLAGATCSYLGTRLSTFIRNRYAPPAPRHEDGKTLLELSR